MKNVSPVKIWRKQKKIPQFLGKTGRVISWTKIHTPSTGFEDEVPYVVVLVELNGGLRLVGQLVDFEEKIKKRMKVKTAYRRIGKAHEEGVINYGLKFKALSSQ